mmetsp:Transcript_46624/g.154588  ORF Transcript_46624/g.154588 Transcript_46624/m.154588 type:complete len:256 (-) Transcript_46624:846-1613(-)
MPQADRFGLRTRSLALHHGRGRHGRGVPRAWAPKLQDYPSASLQDVASTGPEAAHAEAQSQAAGAACLAAAAANCNRLRNLLGRLDAPVGAALCSLPPRTGPLASTASGGRARPRQASTGKRGRRPPSSAARGRTRRHPALESTSLWRTGQWATPRALHAAPHRPGSTRPWHRSSRQRPSHGRRGCSCSTPGTCKPAGRAAPLPSRNPSRGPARHSARRSVRKLVLRSLQTAARRCRRRRGVPRAAAPAAAPPAT